MKKWYGRGEQLFGALFLTGFVAGVLYLVAFGRTAADRTSLMSAYFFSKYQQVEFASEELFFYTLRSRMTLFTLVWLAGVTGFGGIAVPLCLLWLGAALGITASAAAMQMGFGGILLCIASGLPQFILYVPAVYGLFRKIFRMEPLRREWRGSSARRQAFLLWGLGFLLFLVGSLLESYVNPIFLKTILKKI